MNPTQATHTRYRYLGDRNTRDELLNAECTAIRNAAGKCIRGRNGAMLVRFACGPVVVLGRRLRKIT